MNVLEQSLASIAGFERRGYKAKAAERLGVSPCSIYRWQRTGFSPNTATIVWLATDKTANLQELIEFGASLGGGYYRKEVEDHQSHIRWRFTLQDRR